MGTNFVLINKNTSRKFSEVIWDADNSVGFVTVGDFTAKLGEMPQDDKTYFLATWPDSEMYQEHEQYSEEAYETEDGVMIPMAWEQFIPSVLIDRSDED